MGQERQFSAIHLTPAAGMPSVVPNQIEGAIPQGPPCENLHRVLCRVDLDQGSRRQQVGHTVILRPDDCITEAHGIGASLEKPWQILQTLRLEPQESCLLRAEVRVEVKLKPEGRQAAWRSLQGES